MKEEEEGKVETGADAGRAEGGALASALMSQSGEGRQDRGRIAELERQLQQERVERGRLKQTGEELRVAKEEIARLKAENESLTRRGRASDYLSEEERSEIDARQLGVIEKMVDGRLGEAKAESARLREEIARRDASLAGERERAFNERVEALVPGLVASITGERREAWMKWAGARRRAASVRDAFSSLDADTVADFLGEFASETGIRADGDGAAARPRTSHSFTGGAGREGAPKGDSTVYTVEQYGEELRRAASDYDAGRITLEERRAVERKFDKALAEGRVVKR